MGRDKTFKEGAENECPAHRVTISFDFKIGSYPVTQEEFKALMGYNPSSFINCNNSLLRPVDSVTFDEAKSFCQKLTKNLINEKIINCDSKVSLPGEALWEYVASLETPFPKKRREMKKIAWYEDNSFDATHEIGKLAPFPKDIYDLFGNVLEWCLDSEAPDYRNTPATATPCIFKGYEKKKIVRGGSWADLLPLCHKTTRQSASINMKSKEIGFRCFIVPADYEPQTFDPPVVEVPDVWDD